jgi:hypothetical protein
MREEQENLVQEGNEEEEVIEIEAVTPVIVDLGKTKRKKIKKLKHGDGPLMEEVLDVLDEVAEHFGEELEGKTIVPIVLIYEVKGKKKRKITLPF